jgi:hypothetical protein
MRVLGLSLAVLVGLFAAGAHVVLYRLIVAHVAWAARHRRIVAGAIVVLAVFPVARTLATHAPVLRLVGQIGTLWHLVLVTATVPFLVVRLAVRLLRPATPPVAVVPSEPEAPPAPPPPASVPEASRRELIVGVTALGASATLYGWGAVVERRQLVVEELAVKMPRLARTLDGFTIVQLSDIHVGPLMDERELGRIVGRVNELKPDLIVLTGDIIDSERRFVAVGARGLAELKSRFGVLAIPGNHDHYTGLDQVRSGLARGNVEMLVNRGKVVAPADGGIAILGVDDLWARHFGAGPDIAKARAMVSPDLPTVLLAHQPPFFDERGEGIDLQLSGHTHGGQINPGFSPTKLLFRYVAGRYDHGGSTLYVNRGLGVVGPPCRLGAPPEITKIVLTT